MQGEYVKAQVTLQNKYEQAVVRVKDRFVGLINKAHVVKSRIEQFKGKMEEYLSFIGIGTGTGTARQSPTKTTFSTSRDGELSKQICASIFAELSKF